ncbi:MAG: hypothetical protein HY928_16200 [Elusimicrobia bacterium]|nr:hypothetical protein [Elusimicrobiota bacterium]
MSTATTRPTSLQGVSLRPLVQVNSAPGQYGPDFGSRRFGQVFELEAGHDVRLSLDLGDQGPIPNRLLVDSTLGADEGHLLVTKRGTRYAVEPKADSCLERGRSRDQQAHAVGVVVGHWREG